MKISYYPGGKKTDIRKKAGKAIKTYTVAQGSCSDGSYIYMAFEQKKSEKKKHRVKIVKMRASDLKVVKISKALNVGHANDLTIKGGILYITHSKGSATIHRVKAGDLSAMKGIKVTGIPAKIKDKVKAYNGIAWDGKHFLIKVMSGSLVLVCDASMKVTRVFKLKKSFKVSQGMAADGKYIYRGYSVMQSKDKNRLAIFDYSGKLVKTGILPLTGELEGIFLMGRQLYGSVHRRYKKKGKTKRKAYVFRVIT